MANNNSHYQSVMIRVVYMINPDLTQHKVTIVNPVEAFSPSISNTSPTNTPTNISSSIVPTSTGNPYAAAPENTSNPSAAVDTNVPQLRQKQQRVAYTATRPLRSANLGAFMLNFE